jgi:uncharacterized membrane protein
MQLRIYVIRRKKEMSEITPVTDSATSQSPSESTVQITHITYALYALGLVTGIFAIAGLIVAYIKRDDAAGTYLASHYSWLIRTFWWGLLWTSIGLILALALVGFVVLGVVWIWWVYRIIKGWLRLSEKREIA